MDTEPTVDMSRTFDPRYDQALLALNDRLQRTDDPAEVAYIAAEILGRTLGVGRAGYGTIDTVHETILIERDWSIPGLGSIAGMLRFRDHGSYIEDLERGDTVVVTDAYEDERTRETAAALSAIDARAFINMPVTERDRFVALIFVTDATARRWSADEISFMRDIGQRTRTAVERRRAELKLQTSERRLGTALAIARLGTCEWELASDRVDMDARTRDIFAFPHDHEVTGEMVFARIHPEDVGSAREATRAAFARLGRFEAEYRIVLPDGTVRTIVSTNDIVIDARGRPERTVGVFEDITERRQTEADLRALNESLEQRVAARTMELEQVQAALRQSQRLEAIAQLTGGVAHDFNNLLTVIGGSADLLRRPNLADDKKERYVEAIATTVARASKLTSQLLAFARRQSLTPKLMDARDSIQAVGPVVSSVVGEGVSIAISAPAEPCFVNADRVQLDNAIVNLATNARDAMGGRGAITISISRVDGVPPVRGHPFKPGAFLAIAVRDTGPGIAPENLGRIFEPFYTTKGVGQGTGLGLSQVFGFAKQSGGDVSVDRPPDGGARFTLYLPEVPAPVAPPAEAAPVVGGTHAADGCVLVVEDNPDVREFAVGMLAELGYATVEAADGQAALDELRTAPDRFSLIFTDVMMPGMSGIELGQEVRRLHPGLPVALASGYSDALAESDRLDFELLRKPYSMDQLSTFLTRLMHA